MGTIVLFLIIAFVFFLLFGSGVHGGRDGISYFQALAFSVICALVVMAILIVIAFVVQYKG